jgi:hypothetical protein
MKSPAARVKITGTQGKWEVYAGPYYKHLPILWAKDIDFRGRGRRSAVGPWEPQNRSSRLGSYDEALAEAEHVAIVLCDEEGHNRFYLGIYRVSGYRPPNGDKPGSIVIHEQTSMAA